MTHPTTTAADVASSSDDGDMAVMKSARPQTSAGRIGLVGPLMAIILIGIGVVLLHDTIARTDSRPGRTWTAALADGLDRVTAEWWMIPAGVGIALLGVWLIITALRPRSRKTLPVTSQTGVFLHTRDIARLASAAADDVDGVLSTSTVASRRKIVITVESDRDGVADVVRDTVTQRLSLIATLPKITVRVRPHWQRREGN